MKDCTQDLLNLIPDPKSVSVRATFRLDRPLFAVSPVIGSVTDPAKVDTSVYGTGILQVTNISNKLYFRYVSDISAVWPDFADSGVSLWAGSRPGVSEKYMWYHRAGDGHICYRDYENIGVEVDTGAAYTSLAAVLAPISNSRCYALQYNSTGALTNLRRVNGRLWESKIFGVSSLAFDAVTVTNSLTGQAMDYLYFMDRDAGRILEMSVEPGSDVWGTPRAIVPIDAIDDVYGLTLHKASVINGKVVVTGKLVRTSDGEPVIMDIYLMGPETFSLGRDMFITEQAVGGKLVVVGTKLVDAGSTKKAVSNGAHLFGLDDASLKTIVSDVINLRLSEAEGRSSFLSMELSPELSHAAIAPGAEVTFEFAYGDQWMTAFTGEVDSVNRQKSEGESLVVGVISKAMKRLGQWSPDQGIYLPSQASVVTTGDDLSQILRVQGSWGVYVPQVIYDDTDSNWVYSGTWNGPANNVPQAYNNTYHYNNSGNTTDSASYTFTGTKCIFHYLKGTDRDVHAFWIDDVKVATVDAYAASPAAATWESGDLPYGTHTFKVTRASGGAYITVDAIEYLSNFTPTKYNAWHILATAARSTKNGLMRAKFYNELAEDRTLRNPRFGVGLNYFRETAAEAAVRLGVDPETVSEDMLGHNGLIAIYSRTEYSSTQSGLALYSWVNSTMTQLTKVAIDLPHAPTYVWLQMSYKDGYVRVDWREDGSDTWTNVLSYTLASRYGWMTETGGQGVVLAMKQLVKSGYAAPMAADDRTIAVLSNTPFAASGTVLVEDEQITYTSKSTYTHALKEGSVWNVALMNYGPGYRIGDKAFSKDFPCPIQFGSKNGTDNYYKTAAAWIAHSTYDADLAIATREHRRTCRVKAYDPCNASPYLWYWLPSGGYDVGWTSEIGDTTKGAWTQATINQFDAYVYLDQDVSSMSSELSDPTAGTASHHIYFFPALYGCSRGANATKAVEHGNPFWYPDQNSGNASPTVTDVPIYQYASIDLRVTDVQFFTADEDIQLADALKRLLVQAGGDASCKYEVHQARTLPAATWDVVQVRSHSLDDFIAEIDIPSDLGDGFGIGMAFRWSSPVVAPLNTGYFLHVFRSGTDATVQLFKNGSISVQKCVLGAFPIVGTLKISVHGSVFSVWLNHLLLMSYSDTTHATGGYKAFVAYNPNLVAGKSVTYRFSEENDLLADITVGVRGKGSNVLSELLGDRAVYFRNDADGSMFFYRNATDAGMLPDIVCGVQTEQNDARSSRVRAESVSVVEIADFGALSVIGNIFETINSQYGNNVQEIGLDANAYLTRLKEHSVTETLDTVAHPALQPGDRGDFILDGLLASRQIISTDLLVGFQGESFAVSMTMQVFEP